MNKVLLTLLLLTAAHAALAQEFDEVEKPLSTTCNEVAEPAKSDSPDIELDENIDTSNPELGFFPPTPGSVSEEKAAGEICVTEENRTAPLPEDSYEKTDDSERVLAPCANPYFLTVQAGVRDNYALPFDPANLTPAIMNAVGVTNPARWVGFDQDHPNFHFGHNFQLNFTNYFGYFSGLLTIHLRPIDEIQENDTISLWVTGAPRGWGALLTNLGYSITPGQETTIELDLRTLQTGTSSILAEINQFRNLNVYIQDDTSVDDMVLSLACDNSAIPRPLVGVVRGPSGCGNLPAYDVFFDNEDNRNANNRGGWIGATVSNKNTLLRLCGVDGRVFSPAAAQGASFALVSLAKTCPDGFTRFDRFHDNEDNRPASWDTAPSGSATYTVQPEKNTNMAFCVATGTSQGVPNSAFPSLGVSYGVFGGRTAAVAAPWALDRGFIYLDDEDRRNRNAPANPPTYTQVFLQAGSNTTYYFARVK
jgi:hypothetical protein